MATITFVPKDAVYSAGVIVPLANPVGGITDFLLNPGTVNERTSDAIAQEIINTGLDLPDLTIVLDGWNPDGPTPGTTVIVMKPVSRPLPPNAPSAAPDPTTAAPATTEKRKRKVQATADVADNPEPLVIETVIAPPVESPMQSPAGSTDPVGGGLQPGGLML